jgi:hypothetical protein
MKSSVDLPTLRAMAGAPLVLKLRQRNIKGRNRIGLSR